MRSNVLKPFGILLIHLLTDWLYLDKATSETGGHSSSRLYYLERQWKFRLALEVLTMLFLI